MCCLFIGCKKEVAVPAENNDMYGSFTIENVVLTRCTKDAKEVRIPSNVTKIGRYAFQECSKMEYVEIPASVTEIEDYAFANCSNLRSVYIPESVKKIENSVFLNCGNLETVSIPDSVTSIGSNAFYGCTNLNHIRISGSVTSIQERTFSGCASLTSITIPDSVTKIEGSAFYRCANLESIEIPNSVTEIGEETFKDCSKLKSVEIPASVKSIGQDVFSGVELLTIKYGDTKSEWKKLTSGINLPANVTVICSDGNIDWFLNINNNALIRCDVQASGAISIPDGVTIIWPDAFSSCAKLTSVTIPASVTEIGSGAFSGCNNLTINYEGTRAQWEELRCETFGVTVVCSDDSLGSENQPSALTVVARVVTKCDPSATGYIEIQPGVTAIAPNAFSNCIHIKGVIIPEGVTSIGYEAFKYCSDMLSVQIPSSVAYIGDKAFEYCDRLETVNFTGSVSQLATLGLDTKGFDTKTVSVTCYYGNYSKSGRCYYVEKGDAIGDTLNNVYVVIPSGVTEICSSAFKDCKNIVGVGIPIGVTIIRENAFRLCENLTSVTIPGSVTSIWYGAFYECSGLTSVTIPANVTIIGSYAFYSCTQLTSIKYGGTKAQWNAISKEKDWDYIIGNYTITCTDGIISK